MRVPAPSKWGLKRRDLTVHAQVRGVRDLAYENVPIKRAAWLH